MERNKYVTVRLPERFVDLVESKVKQSGGIFSSKADLIKQGTLRYIEELEQKHQQLLNIPVKPNNPYTPGLKSNGCYVINSDTEFIGHAVVYNPSIQSHEVLSIQVDKRCYQTRKVVPEPEYLTPRSG